MKLELLEIPDIKLLYPKKFEDERGFFSETYNQKMFSEIGIDTKFVQDNQSLSRKVGVLRGLHFQKAPFAQDKLIRVIRGSILDVAVDIRVGSPTFGKNVFAEISSDKWNQIFVPVGFAHGFVTLEPDTEVHYKVSNTYAPETECSIRWDDPYLDIDWQIDPTKVTVSEKDSNAISFAEYCRNPAF
ncbi:MULTISPECIES: dTDP-4-dehydrorhamnose 3,5-epimerase [Thalassospira]|jgi:dTDP-4-dehydrorhamnose 3,5-epimerase|uniref:dTDP-4-dehydrorhamnose 3,5-epimerase n=1 Tax=Thalassospira xiamenensis TaxID=220697 RepID=A0ABR5XV91_9PROT|nr:MULTISPECIES: dTDP-4-dehydrorhamnose 3,5-epimerase [Thalassospira]MAL29964.1 dTDP-4-dehydrorhamnose 3,5-epimerase [Thalassospira sp.]MBR9781016.1 dTDP-4-dehydrorhamnose 3,5-epimerase [Rhodospirillales bacterium]KZC96705.1 dTDP-4-dehydrorhamnose 3,5-epimerase [Thalassospira xiamenensis]KZD04328.1 dTDP-4-dehydrorhamnose 3,5-epimerase [Thalassospira xiamenensis]MBL4840142.1 dTDP-4-dehydrorhamnose 3,5-epimerase [Thalassospira sp.]|tara:strand:+ start:1971 stop:2528 length:558 start_codon:yes stop_codon:yes gene_type:complete